MNRKLVELLGSEGCDHQHEVSWRPVNSRIMQSAMLGPIVLKIFIKDWRDGTECDLSTYAGDTKWEE